MDEFLTIDTLISICKTECIRHNVNFEYFFDKVSKTVPIPLTRKELLKLLDNMMVDAFWGDYDGMYKNMSYPDYCIRKKDSSTLRKKAA